MTFYEYPSTPFKSTWISFHLQCFTYLEEYTPLEKTEIEQNSENISYYSILGDPKRVFECCPNSNKSETHYKIDRLVLDNKFLNALTQAFWCPNVLFSESRLGSKLFWGLLMLLINFYFLCCLFLWFEFDLGIFLTFLGLLLAIFGGLV